MIEPARAAHTCLTRLARHMDRWTLMRLAAPRRGNDHEAHRKPWREHAGRRRNPERRDRGQRRATEESRAQGLGTAPGAGGQLGGPLSSGVIRWLASRLLAQDLPLCVSKERLQRVFPIGGRSELARMHRPGRIAIEARIIQ